MRRRTFLLSLPWVGAACTPILEPESKSKSKSKGQPAPSRPEPIDAPVPVAEVPNHDFWKWDRGPEGNDGSWGESQAERTKLITSEGPFELRPVPSGDPTSLAIVHHSAEGQLRWTATLGTPFVPTGSMVSQGDRLYATHHSAIASGASVSAVDKTTGDVLWTTALEGLGPIGHDKYRNETQIALDERGLVIYGNEAQGQYTEVLDPQTGHQRSLGRPDPRFAQLSWEGKAPDAPFDFDRGPSQLAVADTHYVLTESEDMNQPATLKRFDGHETAWSISLRSEGSCGKAAMRVVQGQLWVAHYCAISSGASLMIIDAATGRVVRTVAVLALGPIAHSEYFNEVELDERHGHVVIQGREAAGRYIEVIDPTTGLARVNLTFWD